MKQLSLLTSLIYAFLLFVLSSSDEFGKSSSENQDLESLEISEVLSSGLIGIGLADEGGIIFLLNSFLGNEFSKLS